ncbi:hypothetical protein BDU57DRAFT_98113 [Ampelomyces quisqualis]|uniref:Uncharacterized protein n=1 Tax=Ampelomyces quisqualis TaxID=50730 RepID=A0A6A5Q715_AMPQU|nr:hypothetical protein BDU57DRAFT_98113 [Ampelomyces quisqualis]
MLHDILLSNQQHKCGLSAYTVVSLLLWPHAHTWIENGCLRYRRSSWRRCCQELLLPQGWMSRSCDMRTVIAAGLSCKSFHELRTVYIVLHHVMKFAAGLMYIAQQHVYCQALAIMALQEQRDETGRLFLLFADTSPISKQHLEAGPISSFLHAERTAHDSAIRPFAAGLVESVRILHTHHHESVEMKLRDE